MEAEKEHMNEVISDIEESRSRLNSLIQLQNELSNRLQISTLSKTHAEAQLEKAVTMRAEMVRDIEELRRQRDVFNRRIEFCREKDAIGMVSKLNELSCGYREYTSEEIRLATDDFSESMRLKSGGNWTNVYRGRMKHGAVAIKMLSSTTEPSEETFQSKVRKYLPLDYNTTLQFLLLSHSFTIFFFKLDYKIGSSHLGLKLPKSIEMHHLIRRQNCVI